jgi:hypothetical protein
MGFTRTRGRRPRAGRGSGWMWAGRSTSCILWPSERRRCPSRRWRRSRSEAMIENSSRRYSRHRKQGAA